MISQETINQDALDLVLSTKNHFKEVRKSMGYETEWDAAEDTYFNGAPLKYQGSACVRTGALHQAVERIVPKIDKVVFPPDGKFFEIASKTPLNDIKEEEAAHAETLIAEQFYDTQVRAKLIGNARDLCIYGTLFIKTWWRKDEIKRFKRIDGKREKVWETVYSNPDFYSPAIRDIFVDPKDENLEGALVEKIVTDFQTLWAHREREEDGKQKGLYLLDGVLKLKETLSKESDASSQEQPKVSGYAHNPNKDVINAYEYWGDVPLYFFTKSEKDKEDRLMVPNSLITIATVAESEIDQTESQTAVLLRITDNPFDHNEKPYIRCRYIKVNGRLYGLGVISRVTIPLEEELNTLRTQMMDNRTFNLRPKWMKDKNAGIDPSSLTDTANQIIETNDMMGLQALRPNDMTQVGIASEGMIKQDIQDATGASKLLSGTPTGGSLDRTAGGIASVMGAGLERFELVITTFEEELLKPLVRHYWMLNQQFLQTGRDIRIMGDKLYKVQPSEIPYNFDVKFLGIKEIGEKGYKINEINILLQNIMPLAQLGVNPKPLLFEQIKLMGLGRIIPDMDMSEEGQLEFTPEGEVQLLSMGKKVRIDLNDDHQAYIDAYMKLLQQPKLPDNVKANTIEALGQRQLAIQLHVLLKQRMADDPNNG